MTSVGIIPEYVTVPAQHGPATVPGCPVGKINVGRAGVRSSVASETAYGPYVAVPVGPRGTLTHQVWSLGEPVGYVHFDLETFKWAVSHELHGKRDFIQWSEMYAAVEMLQFVRQSAKYPFTYAAAR
jgi:hypothetical protein